MGQVTLKYGTNQVDWEDCSHVNEVDESATLDVTLLDETIVVLRTFDSQSEAQAAREALLELISEGLEGGSDVIIVIEEL